MHSFPGPPQYDRQALGGPMLRSLVDAVAVAGLALVQSHVVVEEEATPVVGIQMQSLPLPLALLRGSRHLSIRRLSVAVAGRRLLIPLL